MPFTPPTLDEVQLTAVKIGLPAEEAERFWYYYAAIDWMVGRHKMKRWDYALTGWKLRWQSAQPKITTGITATLSGMDKVIAMKELEAVEGKVKSIRDSYESHQSMDRQDREKLSRLKQRRRELMLRLGMQVPSGHYAAPHTH